MSGYRFLYSTTRDIDDCQTAYRMLRNALQDEVPAASDVILADVNDLPEERRKLERTPMPMLRCNQTSQQWSGAEAVRAVRAILNNRPPPVKDPFLAGATADGPAPEGVYTDADRTPMSKEDELTAKYMAQLLASQDRAQARGAPPAQAQYPAYGPGDPSRGAPHQPHYPTHQPYHPPQHPYAPPQQSYGPPQPSYGPAQPSYAPQHASSPEQQPYSPRQPYNPMYSTPSPYDNPSVQPYQPSGGYPASSFEAQHINRGQAQGMVQPTVEPRRPAIIDVAVKARYVLYTTLKEAPAYVPRSGVVVVQNLHSVRADLQARREPQPTWMNYEPMGRNLPILASFEDVATVWYGVAAVDQCTMLKFVSELPAEAKEASTEGVHAVSQPDGEA